MPRSKAAPNVGGSSAKQNDDQALMVECERNIEESSETVSFPSPSQSLGMSTSTPQKRTREDDDDDALFSSLELENQGNGQAVLMAAFMSSPAESSQGNGSAAADPEAYFALQKKLKNETEKREIEVQIAALKLACTIPRKLAAYAAVSIAKKDRDAAVKDRDTAALAAAVVRDAAALAAAIVVHAAESVLELATLRLLEVQSILKQRVYFEKKLLTLNEAV